MTTTGNHKIGSRTSTAYEGVTRLLPARGDWLILGFCLTVTVASCLYALVRERESERMRFEQRAEQLTANILERLNSYVQVLRGAGGLFAASDSVKDHEWLAYHQRLNLSEGFRGVQALGYIENVPRANLPSFIEAVKLGRNHREETQTFQVWPPTESSHCYVVRLVEPLKINLAALGYDIGSEPIRRAAAEKARDSGEAVLTGRINLVQASELPGTLLLLPVYFNGTNPTNVVQRRAALQGWVYAAFVMEDLMAGLRQAGGNELRFDIYDGVALSPEALLYSPEPTAPLPDHRERLTKTAREVAQNRLWTLRFSALPLFHKTSGFSLPLFIAANGLCISLLAFGITRSLLTSHRRALVLANQMTEKVRLLERAISASKDGVFILDAKQESYPVTFANPAFSKINRHEMDKCLPEDTTFLQSSGLAAAEVIQIRESLKAGCPGRPLIKEQVEDGVKRWYVSSVSPVVDDSGRATHLVGVVQDITELKRKEVALQESQERLELVIRGSNDGIWDWNVVTGEVYFSPRWKSMLGFEDEELENQFSTWKKLLHPADRERAFGTLQAYFEGREPSYELEHRLRHKDGSYRWILSRGVALRDAQGKPVRMAGSHVDLTERKQAEENLKHAHRVLELSETRFRVLSNHAPAGILVYNDNGSCTYANQHASALVGAPPEEAFGNGWVNWVHPEDRDRLASEWLAGACNGEGNSLDFRLLRRDGRVAWVVGNAVRMTTPDGRTSGFIGTLLDITGRKQSEEELRIANNDLARSEENLRRALAELQASHEQLKATQLRLIQAAKLESIGTLAAGLAHEVKNPLQTLVMGLDYLAANVPPPMAEVHQAVQDMRDSVRRADSIVRDMLQFSTSKELATSKEDLNRSVENALRLTRNELVAGRVSVVCELAADLPDVEFDRIKMEQVFVNLVINAVHAMPEGGTLSIRTRHGLLGENLAVSDSIASRFKAGARLVLVEIQDTGSGIPPENLSRIFDPFFTTKPVGSGTGLGLSVTRNIMDLHGGAIDIRNAAQGGVLVTLALNASQENSA